MAAGPSGQPALAGGATDADAPRAQPEVWLVAIVFGAATLFFGDLPVAAVRPRGAAGGAFGNLF